LISYNPIYGAVFNNAWVEGQLADLRPEFYGSAFRAWRDAEQKDGFLGSVSHLLGRKYQA
jgi:hypothetical protein